MGYSCNTISKFSFSSRILWLFEVNINQQGMFTPFNVCVLNLVIWHCFNFGGVDVRVSRKRCASVRARVVKKASPCFIAFPHQRFTKKFCHYSYSLQYAQEFLHRERSTSPDQVTTSVEYLLKISRSLASQETEHSMTRSTPLRPAVRDHSWDWAC